MVFDLSRRSTQMPVSMAALPGCAVGVQLARPPGGGKPALGKVHHVISNAPATARLDMLARDMRLKKVRLALLLEGSEYQFLQVEAPAVPAEELKSAIRWLVKDMLRQPLEQTTLDVLPPPASLPPGRAQSAWVVAAGNPLLRERLLQFRAYDSQVAVLDVPEMAQRNLADCLEEEGRATAVLSINSAGCLLTASRAGDLFFTRNFEVSTRSLAASPSARRDQFDRLVLELQRSLDVLEHQYSFLPVSTLWLAPFAQCEELLGLLIENLYVGVKVINLAEIFDCSDCPLPEEADRQAALFHVLGLALREAEAMP